MRKLLSIFMGMCVAFGLIASVSANPLLDSITRSTKAPAQQQILPVDQAFQMTTEIIDSNLLRIHWDVVEEVYLYDDQFLFTPHHVVLGEAKFPESIQKSDELLGDYGVYYGPLVVDIPIKASDNSQASVDIQYQGCSDSGYCYPPVVETVTLSFAGDTLTTMASTNTASNHVTAPLTEQDRITRLLDDGHMLWVLLAFLGFGLLLTFTPCVLPMVPILSSVILGQGELISRKRAFLLSLCYVLGMAVTYAIAGVLAAMAGSSIQAAMQKSWVLIGFSGLFVVLALSMFGLFELRLPNWIEERIGTANRQLSGGHFYSAVLMGILSALVVSPCITPPLVGALVYIGQTGDSALGGAALFSLGLGMGLPLIIAATFGATLLPKAGAWMNTVKNIFGVLLLGMAIWILDRVFPGPITLALWGCLFFLTPIYLGVFEAAQSALQRLSKGLGFLSIFLGSILLIGAAMGNDDPLQPLANFSAVNHTASAPQQSIFTSVKSVADVQNHLDNTQGKPAFLGFYADWCVSCVFMERTTFRDPEVQALLEQFVALKADVTAGDAIDKELQQRYGVFAPPALLFFMPDGTEAIHLVGGVSASEMRQHLLDILERT